VKAKETLAASWRTRADDAEKARSVKKLIRKLVKNAEFIEVKPAWYVDSKAVKLKAESMV
jgi:hypothetical protein